MAEQLHQEVFKAVETEHDLALRETQGMMERMRVDLLDAVASDREITAGELRRLSALYDNMLNRLNEEHCTRGPTQVSCEEQLQGVRDMIHAAVSAQRKDLESHFLHMQDMSSKIENETSSREAFADRHTLDIQTLNERVEGLSKLTAEMVQGVKKTHDEMADVMRLRNEKESPNVSPRFGDLENRCAAMEARMAEAARVQASSFERLCDRHEHVSQAVDNLRVLQAQIEGEKCCREAFEGRYALDIQALRTRIEHLTICPNGAVKEDTIHVASSQNERIEALSRHAEMIQEQSLGFKRAYDEIANALQNHSRQVMRLRGEGESSIAQANARFNEMEDRCASIESRMAEAASREAASLDRLCDRQDRLWHLVEGLRLLRSKSKARKACGRLSRIGVPSICTTFQSV